MNLKLITNIGIIGAIMVSLGYPLMANIIWSFTNPLLAIHNHRTHQKEQCKLFLTFTLISWLGVILSVI